MTSITKFTFIVLAGMLFATAGRAEIGEDDAAASHGIGLPSGADDNGKQGSDLFTGLDKRKGQPKINPTEGTIEQGPNGLPLVKAKNKQISITAPTEGGDFYVQLPGKPALLVKSGDSTRGLTFRPGQWTDIDPTKGRYWMIKGASFRISSVHPNTELAVSTVPRNDPNALWLHNLGMGTGTGSGTGNTGT